MTGDPAWKEYERTMSVVEYNKRTSADSDHLRSVLNIMGIFQQADYWEGVSWEVQDNRATFKVNVGGAFGLAGGDTEPLGTLNDEFLLRHTLQDLQTAGEQDGSDMAPSYLPELYAARRRKQRPCQKWLDRHFTVDNQKRESSVLKLFLNAGPASD